MKNLRYIIVLAALTAVAGLLSFTPKPAAKQIVVPIAFYNLENLFDTIHDEVWDTIDGVPRKIADKNDYEYLPDGTNHWNSMKYWAKQKNMSYALSQLGIDKQPNGPAIIGVSEITRIGQIQASINYRTFSAYFGVAVAYFCLTFILSRLVNLLERRMAVSD